MRRAIIHYFSGTGNTAHAADLIGAELQEQGYQVSIHNIEERPVNSISAADLNIFAFPVYSFAPAVKMIKYLKKLPRGKNAQTAVVCVCGHTARIPGYEGQAAVLAGRILKRKGYNLFFNDAVSYPENWTQLVNPLPDFIQQRIFREADFQVRLMAKRIGELQQNFKKHNIGAIFLTKIVYWFFRFWGSRFLGKCYGVDGACNSCGRCVQTCPEGVIRLVGGRPRWNWRCQLCNRCINICPQRSIQASLVRLVSLIAVGYIPFEAVLVCYLPQYDILAKILFCLAGLISYFGLCYLADKVIFGLELIPGLSMILGLSFTKHYRRYLAPGFHPLVNTSKNSKKLPPSLH